MQIKFIRLIDELLKDAPQTRKTLEMKEEIVQNLMEKYNDLLREGKSEEAAYNIVASSVGDLGELVDSLRAEAGWPKRNASAQAPLEDAQPHAERAAESARAWTQAAPADPRYRSALYTAIAVMFIILSPVPAFFFRNAMGVLLLFAMVAAGIGLLVMSNMLRPRPEGAQEVPEPSEDEIERRKRVRGAVTSSVWMLTVAFYFVFSFGTGTWHLSWIIFLLASAMMNILSIYFDPQPKKLYSRVSGALWTCTVALYFVVSFATGAWHISWIMFLIAVALNNALKIMLSAKRKKVQ